MTGKYITIDPYEGLEDMRENVPEKTLGELKIMRENLPGTSWGQLEGLESVQIVKI